MKMKRLLSTILAIAMVLVLCPSTQIIFAEEELTATQIKGTVKATADAGAPLGTAVFAYDFANDSENWPIVTAEGDPVDGTFKWNRPTTWLTESGTYAFTFVPADSNIYASYSGEAVVLLNFDKDTAVEKETILEQYFDDEEIFLPGYTDDDGVIDTTGTYPNGGRWEYLNNSSTSKNSMIVSGQKDPVDKHRVQPTNRVLALKQYTTNAGCLEADFFRGNISGRSSTFTASFRVYRAANAPFWVGYGSANNNSYEAQNMVVSFDAEGNITVNGGGTIATLPLNKWATVNIRKAEAAETGAYTISIVSDDGSVNENASGNAKTMSLSDFAAMNFDARGGDNSGTTVAYFDDVYVQRLTDNVVCLNQSFEDSTKFPTDTVPTAIVQDRVDGSNSEKWEFKSLVNNEVTYGACVTELTGEWIEYASSGYQALYFGTDSAKDVHGTITAGNFNTAAFDVTADDFEISLRMYWMGETAVQMPLGRSRAFALGLAYMQIGADGTFYVSGDGSTTVNKAATNGKMPAKVWTTLNIVSNRSAGTFTVTGRGDDGSTFSVEGKLSTLSGNLGSMWFYGLTKGAAGGYLDDFKFVKISSGVRTVMIDQNFEDVTMFDASASYDRANYASDGVTFATNSSNSVDTWKVETRADAAKPAVPVINTHDGDGLIDNLELVYSESQALKVMRAGTGGAAAKANFRRVMDYAIEDYRVTFKLRLGLDNFQFSMGNDVIAYADSAFKITTGYKVQTMQDGELADFEGTLQPYIWYDVTLETDRANSGYTVTFEPLSNGFETVVVEGDTRNAATAGNNGHLRFNGYYAGNSYVDDVKLVTLTPAETARPTYTASLPAGFESDETPALDQNYTFRATNTYYNYTFNATIGGQEVAVTDNGDGTYTLGPVGGDVVIEEASRDGKSQTVTLTIDDVNDVVDFANTAKYDTDYALKLNPADGYNYSVAVTIGGEEYELADPVNNIYTIEGTAITGAIEITVTRELKTYDVIFAGNGAGNADGAETATHGQDYTFTVNAAVGVDYTVIFNEEVLTPVDGVYTIPGAQVTSPLTIQVGKVSPVRPEELVVTVPAGGALKDATIVTQVFVDAETGLIEISGTFTWHNPTLWMNENREVEYTFTPDDLENYKPYTGTVMVTMVGEMSATPVMGLQNFDDTGKFVLGAAGAAVDGWTYGESAVVSGTNPPADQHNVFHNNRVLALKRYSNYASGTVNAVFYRGNAGKTTDFVASFRVCRVADKAFYLAYGGGSYELTIHNLAIKFDANGDITLDGGSNVIGNLAKNVWATVNIVTNKGGAEAGPYTITIVADDGTTIANTTGTTTAYGLSNLNQVTVFAIDTAEDGTTIAYFDDIYVQRKSDDVVCLDQDFDGSDFVTDQVYAENVKVQRDDNDDSRYEEWKFVKNSDGTGASIVADITDGDYYTPLAYSGHQSLYLNRGTGGNRQFSVGHVYSGSNFPYFAKETLYKEDDFEYSFRFYWTGGAFEVFFARLAGQAQSQSYLSVDASGAISVFNSENDTSIAATTNNTLPLNQWCNITVTSNRTSNQYTVKVDGEVFATGYLKPDNANSTTVGGLIFKAGYNARAGYLDDVSFDKIVLENGEVVERTPLINQNFENTNDFDTSYSYANSGDVKTFDVGGTGGYWKLQFTSGDLAGEPLFINTHDGDGLVTDFVYSNDQALKLSNGNPFQYALAEAFTAEQNYTFSARVFLNRGKAMTITFADAEDAADAVVSLNNTALMPNTWATVTLKTDRDTGKYTVTVTPDNGAKYEVQGDLAGKAVSQILFATESDGTAAFVDNVSLAKNDLIIADKPVYEVSLPDGLTAQTDAVLGETFVFAIDNNNYTYTNITAIMDGNAVEVTDNGNGTYTIANVCGDIEVTATVTPKTYTVTVNGSAESSVSASGTATYATDYVFTVEKETGYTYEVVVRWTGGQVAFAEDPDGTYTILGADIRGDLTITVNKTIKKYAIDWQGNALEELAGKRIEVEHGQEYYFIVNKVAGYDYTVTVDGETLDLVDGKYTIAQGVITGPITIAVNKELTSYTVSFSKQPAELEVTGEAAVQHGAEYTFRVPVDASYSYTVSAAIGGNAVAVTDNGDGSYTIAAGVINGDLTISIFRLQVLDLNFEFGQLKVEAGKALGTLTLTGTATDAQGNPVAGTFAWVRPSTWMDESKECAFIFTPDDNTIAPVEGTVTVSIYSETMDEEVILDQNFDDEEIFQVGVAGTGQNLVIDATGSNANGGTWKGVYAGAATGSHVISGTNVNLNPPVDKHRVQPTNRVLALKQYTTNAGCLEADFFRGNISGRSSTFTASFRVYRAANAPFWVGYGSANNNSYEAQNMVVSFDAEGNITVNGGETITTLPLNKWATVNIRKAEAAETGAYTISIVSDDGSVNENASGNAKTMSLSDFAAMNFDARGGDNSGTTVAYFDDIYVQRLTDNVVCLNQSFEDSTKFPTDTVPTAIVQDRVDGSNSEKWEFKTLVSGEVTYGACVTELVGEWIEYAYSGHQALSVSRSSGKARMISVGNYYAGSNTPYINKNDLTNEHDFEYSFRLFWRGGLLEVFLSRLNANVGYSSTYLKILANGTIQVFGSDEDTSTLDTSSKTVPLNKWSLITVTADRSEGDYVVKVNGEEFITGCLKDLGSNNTVGGLIFNAGLNALAGYLDDVKVRNLTTDTTIIDQSFEDTNVFSAADTYADAGESKTYDVGGTGGYWKIQASSIDAENPVIINTHDGDGEIEIFEPVYSEYQAMKVARLGGSALDADLRRAMDYATENYRLTFKLRLVDDNLMITMGNNAVAYSDAAVQITTGYKIQTLQNGALADTESTLHPGVWYDVTLKTDRANSDYTVTFVPLCNGLETVTVYGDTNNAATAGNNQRVRFYAGYNVTAGYIDDVKLVALTAHVEDKATYNVDLADGISGAETAALDSNYTFTIDGWTVHKDYTFDATMGGNPVEVIDNGGGTYTIEGVYGDIVIDNLASTGKPMNVTIDGNGTGVLDDVIGSGDTVIYGESYTFTVNMDENYNYSITVTVDGDEIPLPDPVDGAYTIASVTGELVITVDKTEKTVNVDVDWGAMTFEYEHTSWDAETHSWNGAWNPGNTNYITVTNVGGVAITVRYYFAVEQGKPVNRVTSWNFTSDAAGETVISEAVPLEVGADPYTAYLNLTGTPTEEFEDEVLGTVTVEIQ